MYITTSDEWEIFHNFEPEDTLEIYAQILDAAADAGELPKEVSIILLDQYDEERELIISPLDHLNSTQLESIYKYLRELYAD